MKRGMIQPMLQDDAFLADVAAASADLSHCHLWWLGQSGFLVKHRSGVLLVDPYLSDSLTKKYAATAKPHVRMSERVVDPRRLDFIDVVTSSHHHTDHLDPETLVPVMRANPAMKLVIPEANRVLVGERLGVHPSAPIGLTDGKAFVFGELEGFSITAVPAAHDALERDEKGNCRYLGYVIRSNAGAWSIYHSGDTVWHEEIVRQLRALKTGIDVAILPINGKVGNMAGHEAAQLAHAIGAKVVVPCHYHMFEFNTAEPEEEFVPECGKLGQAYRVLQQGERLTIGTAGHG